MLVPGYRICGTPQRSFIGFFDVNRKEYEKGGGLRTVKDLREEQRKRMEMTPSDIEEEEFRKTTIFGTKRKRPIKETLFYTDRSGGKG